MPVNIFFCYARKDKALLNKLKTQLSPLLQQNLITIWYDHDIRAGTAWEPDIREHLNTAQIILLLVSPDFMASHYAYSIEMKRALERHENGEAEVIPIIIRPVHWHEGPLGKLQALPTNGEPVTSSYWHDLDTAFYDVTQGILEVVRQLIDKQDSPSSAAVSKVQEEGQHETALTSSMAMPIEQASNVASLRASSSIEILSASRAFEGHTRAVRSVAISSDGRWLFSGGSDLTIKVWDSSIGQEVRTLTGHTRYVWSVAISSDEQWLFSGSFDETIKVWDLSTGQEVRTLVGHTDRVRSVAISSDGQWLFSGSYDKTIKVWDLSTGQAVRTLIGHTDTVRSVAISSDGQWLFSGSEDLTIKVWDLSTRRPVRTLWYGASVMSVAISGDGKTLVSGGSDRTIKVWDLLEQDVQTLTGHTDAVRSVAISSDGQWLFSGSYDGTIKVWDLSTRREVCTLTEHRTSVTSVAISRDGKTLVSGDCQGTIRVWRMR